MMKRLKLYLFLFAVLSMPMCSQEALAMRALDKQGVFSPFTAQVFHKIGCELSSTSEPDSEEYHQAMMFLIAASKLDPQALYIYGDVLTIGSNIMKYDYSRVMLSAMDGYVNKNIDIQPALLAAKAMVQQQESREGREQILKVIMEILKDRNKLFTSEIATQWATLASEKADFNTAFNQLRYALEINPYNHSAFVKYDQLLSRQNKQLEASDYLIQLRRKISVNPFDLQAVVEFARYAEQLELYDIASDAYIYALELFDYLFSESVAPRDLYYSLAASSYNTDKKKDRLKYIVSELKKHDQFDFILEAASGKAALDLGDPDAEVKLHQLAKRAERLLESQSKTVRPEQLAWFYTFIIADNQKALAWSNRAYAVDPESEDVVSLFAYTLAQDGQYELAERLMNDTYEKNQIASLAKSLILENEGMKDLAIEVLKNAIMLDPASFAALRSKEMLERYGSVYLSKVPRQVVMDRLNAEYGLRIVPVFKKPSEMYNIRLNFAGSEFSYGKDFDAQLVIQNNSDEPLIINDTGVIKGHIRIDVQITGDFEMSIPEVINKKIRMGAIIKPGQYIALPVDLNRGRIQKVLNSYPQASIEMNFKTYIDPYYHEDVLSSAIPDFDQIEITVKRPPVILSRDFLMQRLDVLNSGTRGQKSKVVQLFAGLLAEQYLLDVTGPLYRHMKLEKDLLIDSVKRGLRDEQWIVRVKTMFACLDLPQPLDYDLIRAVSENLKDEKWPVRFLTLFVLSKQNSKDFKQVLDWTAEYDINPTVANIAIAMGGDMPEKKEEVTPVDE